MKALGALTGPQISWGAAILWLWLGYPVPNCIFTTCSMGHWFSLFSNFTLTFDSANGECREDERYCNDHRRRHDDRWPNLGSLARLIRIRDNIQINLFRAEAFRMFCTHWEIGANGPFVVRSPRRARWRNDGHEWFQPGSTWSNFFCYGQ